MRFDQRDLVDGSSQRVEIQERLQSATRPWRRNTCCGFHTAPGEFCVFLMWPLRDLLLKKLRVNPTSLTVKDHTDLFQCLTFFSFIWIYFEFNIKAVERRKSAAEGAFGVFGGLLCVKLLMRCRLCALCWPTLRRSRTTKDPGRVLPCDIKIWILGLVRLRC